MRNLDNISNNRIKEIVKLHQKKHRNETGLFIAEGFKACEEIINSNIEIIDIFVKNDVISTQITHPYKTIDEATMKKISTTDTPCEILIVAKQKIYKIEDIKEKNHILLLDNISDPGNIGTIIRSSAAFGIDAIILFGDCVDLYSPKVIRSSTGNLFKTPIYQTKDINVFKNFSNHKKIATSLSKKNNITIKECSKIPKYIIMMGSEANGLQSELLNISDKNIRLDMKNGVESLNLSVSASIIMYELFIN